MTEDKRDYHHRQEFLRYLEHEKNLVASTIETCDKVMLSFYQFIITQLQPEPQYMDPLYRKHSDVKKYITYLETKEDPLKRNTINKYITCLKGYFDFLERTGKIGVDPIAKMKGLREERVRNYNTFEELEQLQHVLLNSSDMLLSSRVFLIMLLHGIPKKTLLLPDFVSSISFPTAHTVEIHLGLRTVVFTDTEADYIRQLYEETQPTRDKLGTGHLFYKRQRSKDGQPTDGPYLPINAPEMAARLNLLSKTLQIPFTASSLEAGWLFHQMDTTPFPNLPGLCRELGYEEKQLYHILLSYDKAKKKNREQQLSSN